MRSGVVVLVGLVAAAGCTDDDGVGPEADRLSGTYTLSDWHYVIQGDTLELTDDSYVRIEFIDDEHVRGEGFVWLLVPVPLPDGGVDYQRQPVLGTRNEAGEIVATPLEGWYYLSRDAAADTLRFRLAKGAGAGTWIEEFDWLLTSDWGSYSVDVSGRDAELRIVHSRR